MCAMDEKALARPFRVAVASDHAGFDLKTQIIRLLSDLGHEVEDFGARSAEPVDFADYVYPAALAVSDGRLERAILVDGAGYPSGIVANMLPNVYAAVANDPLSARYAREHSDTNVLCLGARIIGAGLAGQIVETWMIAKFLGGKYAARVEKVRRLASKHRRDPGDQTRKVLTVQDMRDAILRRQSMIIDDKTIMTPALLDFVRTVSG